MTKTTTNKAKTNEQVAADLRQSHMAAVTEAGGASAALAEAEQVLEDARERALELRAEAQGLADVSALDLATADYAVELAELRAKGYQGKARTAGRVYRQDPFAAILTLKALEASAMPITWVLVSSLPNAAEHSGIIGYVAPSRVDKVKPSEGYAEDVAVNVRIFGAAMMAPTGETLAKAIDAGRCLRQVTVDHHGNGDVHNYAIRSTFAADEVPTLSAGLLDYSARYDLPLEPAAAPLFTTIDRETWGSFRPESKVATREAGRDGDMVTVERVQTFGLYTEVPGPFGIEGTGRSGRANAERVVRELVGGFTPGVGRCTSAEMTWNGQDATVKATYVYRDGQAAA